LFAENEKENLIFDNSRAKILSSIANVEEDSNAYDSNFADSDNFSCEQYVKLEWCTSPREYGTNWNSKWGTFDDHLDINGNTALVCPECGCVETNNERHESYTSLYYSESDSSVSKISEKENLEGETKNEDLNLEKELKRYDLSILSSLAEDQYYKDGRLQSEMMDKLPNFKKNNLEDNN
jgi:hypothetical protein